MHIIEVLTILLACVGARTVVRAVVDWLERDTLRSWRDVERRNMEKLCNRHRL